MSLNDFGSPETDLFTSLFSVAPDSSATEHLPTPRVRFLHPEPSANVTPANRIPDDALLTRAVPPDELDEDDLEDGEIDEEDYESDLDYNDLYQDDAQDMEDYMLALGSDDDDFSEYGDVQFQFGQQAMLNNNDSGDQLWDELHRGLMRGGFQRQERVAAQPNNAPAAATGELNVADIQSFATRMTQSIESKDAEIKQLKEEVERLKEIIESDNEKKRWPPLYIEMWSLLGYQKSDTVLCKFALWTLFLQDMQRLLKRKSRQQMPQMSSASSQADRYFRLTSSLHSFTFVFNLFHFTHDGQNVLFSIEANP